MKKVISPKDLKIKYSPGEKEQLLVEQARKNVQKIIERKSHKILAIVGPCSIHNYSEALEYAEFISEMRDKYKDSLEIIMRVYFEKPRTRSGWKGLIYDPWIDGSGDVNSGLELARRTMLGILQRDVPIGHELLDPITPNYLSDLISWGAIGARTVESQIHRQMASACDYPVGFKNSTAGSVQVAIDAIKAAELQHTYMTTDDNNSCVISESKGNRNGHLVLRGGGRPNYYREDIEKYAIQMLHSSVQAGIIVDSSHGNSQKDYRKQSEVIRYLLNKGLIGSGKVVGVMIESNLNPGKQEEAPLFQLKRGISITDGCIGLDDTKVLLELLSNWR